jgi:hypothetical protein
MQEINAWLRTGKDFETGKALYLKFGKNTLYKSLLNNQKATRYDIKKLNLKFSLWLHLPLILPTQRSFFFPPALKFIGISLGG